MRWWKGVVIAGVVILVGFLAVVWWVMPRPVQMVGPNGSLMTLEEYYFSTNTVQYHFPKSLFDEKIFQLVPKVIRGRFERPVTKRIYSKPLYPGEPRLSCGVSVTVTNEAEGWWGRLVVADEHGNEFDPVGQSGAGNAGENPVFEVFEVPAFPRRGQLLKLKLKRDAETYAEFEVPNPERGKYPQWKAAKLPVSASAGDLKAALVDFVSEHPKVYSGESFPNTSCVFELVQGGAVTTNWIPLSAEIWDATGNHWSPWLNHERVKFEDGKLRLSFHGALWAGEDAWKLQMVFRQFAAFAEEELLRFEGLEVPEGADMVRPKLVHAEAEGRVEMLGLFGPNADRDLTRKIFLNIYPQFGVVTVALKVELAKHERAFSLVGVYDEKGVPMELKEVTPVDWKRGRKVTCQCWCGSILVRR